MTSTSAVHAVGGLPHILDITDIAGHHIYDVIWFTVEIASYWIWLILELLAQEWVVMEKLRDYLLGPKITMYTDNNHSCMSRE